VRPAPRRPGDRPGAHLPRQPDRAALVLRRGPGLPLLLLGHDRGGDREQPAGRAGAARGGGAVELPALLRPELAAEIAAQEGEIRLGGTKRQAVVLFADIRGFTTLSEALSPDEIASLLNEYFTEMVEIVFEYGGTLDKFMGDAMMAIWGAPLHRPDDPDRAARAAVAMQRELRLRNEEWGRQGRRPLTVGIGLQAGEVFAGNIGSDRRLEYTVIGDAVNTAAHLCSEAGPGEILLGETLYQTLVAPPRSPRCRRSSSRGRPRRWRSTGWSGERAEEGRLRLYSSSVKCAS